MAALFLAQELFVAHGLEVDRTVLFKAFFIAQFVAFIGSLVFERIAHFTSTKTAIMISLLIWSLIVIYAYGFLHTIPEAYVMSGAIGFVLGGSQALSRSLFSQMIPKGREAAFFGIYAISEKEGHPGSVRSSLASSRSSPTRIGRLFSHSSSSLLSAFDPAFRRYAQSNRRCR